MQLDPDAPSDGFLDGYGLSVQGDSALVLSGFTNVIDTMFTHRFDTALTSLQLPLHDRTPGEWIEEQVILSNGNIPQASFAASPLTRNYLLIRGLVSDGTSNCSNSPCTVSLSTTDLVPDLTLAQNPAIPIVSVATTLFPTASITL